MKIFSYVETKVNIFLNQEAKVSLKGNIRSLQLLKNRHKEFHCTKEKLQIPRLPEWNLAVTPTNLFSDFRKFKSLYLGSSLEVKFSIDLASLN